MIDAILTEALKSRKKKGLLENTEAVRIFHGPGETEHPELQHLAIDRYGDHLWLTEWRHTSEALKNALIQWAQKNIEPLRAVVLMDRSEIASEKEVRTLWGEARSERFSVIENGIPYLVQMTQTKHPGLFLDHVELRQWLKKTQSAKSVLNLFAYTGSLSVAAGIGGAGQVTTLDLSKATIEWAKENWIHAGLPSEHGDFIFGDVFEWLPRMKKRGSTFDTIISDPPSFSRSKSGVFSTKKDLMRLHELILPLLKPGGTLITSINSESISDRFFWKEIEAAAHQCGVGIRQLRRVEMPQTFPMNASSTSSSHPQLKGFYLEKTSL